MATGTGFTLADDAPRTVPDWIRERAATLGDKTALTIMGQSATYAEIDHQTDRVGAGLAALGLEPGEHCALMMKNSLANVDTWFGMSKAGVVELAVHNAARGNVLHHVLDHGDASAIVLDEEFLPALHDVIERLPDLRHVVVHRETDGVLDPVVLEHVQRTRQVRRRRRPDGAAADRHGLERVLFTAHELLGLHRVVRRRQQLVQRGVQRRVVVHGAEDVLSLIHI